MIQGLGSSSIMLSLSTSTLAMFSCSKNEESVSVPLVRLQDLPYPASETEPGKLVLSDMRILLNVYAGDATYTKDISY